MADTNERSAVLIVRAWVEHGQVQSFRARIMQSTDSGGTEQTIVTTTDPNAVMTALHAWLEALLSDDAKGKPA
jgi:hypothetical protein